MKHFLQKIQYIFKSAGMLLVFIMILSAGSFAQTFTTEQDGSWVETSTWGGNFPAYNGGLSNNTKIYINHNVQLIGESFQTGNNTNTLEIHVGNGINAVTLIIDKNFTISKTIKLYVNEGSTLQIGTVPADPLFDFCDDGYGGDYERSLFKVEGSNQDPTLNIKQDGTFLLYGDFRVENKFDIIVEEGGQFIVKGNFDAGNSAEVSFTGAGGEVGCDMTFDNSASVSLSVGTLWVGGDLNFGNSGDVYLSGSTLNVNGGICSTHGVGSGAVINLHGDAENPSTISAGSICSYTFGDLDNNPGIDIDDNFLPIELLSFNANAQQDKVVLSWATATEVNNDYFSIERSADLKSWEQVGMVRGAGTTSMTREYSLIDYFPLKDVSYYRLKQTDFDGTFEYFAPVAVSFDQTSEIDFKVLKNGSSWTVVLPGVSNFQVEVYTLSGYRLFTASGSHNLSIPNPQQTVVIRVLNDRLQNASRVVM